MKPDGEKLSSTAASSAALLALLSAGFSSVAASPDLPRERPHLATTGPRTDRLR